MAHPHNEHRQHRVEKSRAHHLLRGYAKGGAVKASIGKEALSLHKKEHAALHAEGGESKHRMDRPKRAKGGRVGKHKGNARTIVNVITGGHPAGGAMPPPPPMGIAGPPPAMPAPPMAAKPPMPMPPPGAGMPPGGPPMPMRKKGGRVHRDDGGGVDNDDMRQTQQQSKATQPKNPMDDWNEPTGQAQQAGKKRGGSVSRAKGGRVNQGSPVFEEGRRAGTQVQHSDGHATANKNLGRGKPVTFKSGGRVRSFYAHGGRVESPKGVAKETRLPGGSGGGEARLVKAKRAAREYHGPA